MYYYKTDRKIIPALIVLTLVVLSCNKKSEVAPLYNIDSLITSQVGYLSKKQAQLLKEARIGSQQDDSVYKPKDTLAWANEFEIFRELSAINKPTNRDSYIIDDNLFDPASNLTVKAFSLKEGLELPVKYVRIFYLSSLQKPKKIEALYNEKNLLSASSRLLTMEFKEIRSINVLTSYSIQGGQKMILGDSVSFLIMGKIISD
ncbi:hypothetical protein [Chryseosolibacter indicus]|uniref:Lipoprotein n=1 Tax=Chryseosolibacter indicus TaxID=2782351 RepID=A0ABS5VS70_9BACT|nr:hypothetical protein [Chryseosolibacter indicus]MBT1704196.1 hypothetical protein [Chryseosolibacter indicus]